MANEKRTQAEIFADMLKLNGVTDEMKDLINKEIAKREKKKSADKKPTKEQEEALAEANKVYDLMVADKWYSVGELMKLCNIDSCQKMTNRLLTLKANNLVENEKQKGKSMYRKVIVAESEDEAEG
jgi:hypothetical protein